MKMSSGENLTINDSPIINSPLTSSPLLSAPVSAPLTSSPSNVRYSSGLYHNGVKYEWGKAPTPITTSGIYWSESLGLISLSSNGSNWITIADKNLGAADIGYRGKFYQRGNNYGFNLSGNTTTNIQKNVSNYGPGEYTNSEFVTGYNNRWTSDNFDLWGDITNTNISRQGPCNNGFHIPTDSERQNVMNVITSSLGVYSSAYAYLKIYPTYVIYIDGSYGESSNTYLWTSSKINGNAKCFYVTSNTPSQLTGLAVANACQIRPFTNTPVQPTETRTKLF